jgi:hypothetical protein
MINLNGGKEVDMGPGGFSAFILIVLLVVFVWMTLRYK